MPIAIGIGGIILIQVSGHLAAGMSNTELFDMAIMVLLVMLLCIISLIDQKNLMERIAIAIDWFIIPIFLGRLVGAVHTNPYQHHSVLIHLKEILSNGLYHGLFLKYYSFYVF